VSFPKWIEEIEQRAKAATPGEWELDIFDTREWGVIARRIISHDGAPVVSSDDEFYANQENFDFILSARTDIPRLLAALKIATEALEEMQKAPYSDSDLRSLLEWVNSRAREALKRIAKL
jgi:hypothetical protein